MKGKKLALVPLLLLVSCGTQSVEETNEKNFSKIDTSVKEHLETNETIMTDKQLENGQKVAVITTNKGKIKALLYTDKTPFTANNFIGLAKDNYYDGVVFHRVIKGFMIQGGDPDGTGMGGESIYGEKFDDEFVDELSNKKFTLSMANAGPGTNGSQFFINVADNTFLDGKHSVFGEVIEGEDTVMAISKAKTTGADRPENEIKMIEVEVYEYKDGKLESFDFDKNEAVEEYKTIKNAPLEMGDTALLQFTIKETGSEKEQSARQAFPLEEEAEILIGLRDELLGKNVGATGVVTLTPELGFGAYDEANVQDVPRENMAMVEAQGIELEAGLVTPFGNIVSVAEDTVKLDTNVPYAGKTVEIEYEILEKQ